VRGLLALLPEFGKTGRWKYECQQKVLSEHDSLRDSREKEWERQYAALRERRETETLRLQLQDPKAAWWTSGYLQYPMPPYVGRLHVRLPST
jgi:hypothetical protein